MNKYNNIKELVAVAASKSELRYNNSMNKYNNIIKELVAVAASKSELCAPSYGLDRYNNKLKKGYKVIWKGSYNTVEIWDEVIEKINKVDPGWEPYIVNELGYKYGMFKKFAN